MYGLILTYVLSVVSGLASLRYPVIGVMAFIGLGVLRPRFIFGFAGEIVDVSFWVGVAVLTGWVFTGFGSWRAGRARPAVIALAIYILCTIISAVQALDTTVSARALLNEAKLFMPVIVGLTVVTQDWHRRWLFWTIVLAQAYVGFEMNLEYLRGRNVANMGFGGMDNNFFGASLVATLGPAIALAVSSRWWPRRLLAYVATALIFHTTLLTFSRGAMVGMLAVAATAFFLIPKSPRFLAAALVLTLLAARLTGPQLMARYSTAFVGEENLDRSAESRVELWRDCLTVVADHPVFGVGPANWRVIANSYGWPEGKSAHSVWMESAAEIGLPGVIALLCFFGLTALKLWPLARAKLTDENQYDVAIATGVILSIVGFSVAGQFVSASNLEPPYYVALVGLSLLKNRPGKPAAATAVKPHNPALSPLVMPIRPAGAAGPIQNKV